ncbi:hypothetical protein BGW38_000317, partial [Lunasporangiospora selenospora]
VEIDIAWEPLSLQSWLRAEVRLAPHRKDKVLKTWPEVEFGTNRLSLIMPSIDSKIEPEPCYVCTLCKFNVFYPFAHMYDNEAYPDHYENWHFDHTWRVDDLINLFSYAVSSTPKGYHLNESDPVTLRLRNPTKHILASAFSNGSR